MDNYETARIERVIAGALRSTIDAHGSITPEHLGSAAKRVRCQLAALDGPHCVDSTGAIIPAHDSSEGMRAPIHPVKDRHHMRSKPVSRQAYASKLGPPLEDLARDLRLCLGVLTTALKAKWWTDPTGEREEVLGECETALANYDRKYGAVA